MAKDRRLRDSYNLILHLYHIAAPCSGAILDRSQPSRSCQPDPPPRTLRSTPSATWTNARNYSPTDQHFHQRRTSGNSAGIATKPNETFHLDHLAPVSKDGTSHEIQNRAPMCPYHNIRKSNRQVALSQYRQEIAKANELMVDSIEDLISLDYALAHAMQIFGEAYARKYPQRRITNLGGARTATPSTCRLREPSAGKPWSDTPAVSQCNLI